ncbi:MAG TPA: hypothetical protein VKV32_17225 [Stellaceae bacterium]|nr:hypothetical protein [Stellaceae bacterium]
MAVNPAMSSGPRGAPMGGIAPAADPGATASAVSWAAVFAGGVGAVATSIILLELGLGLGFASTSAWPNAGTSLATLGVMGGVWLILTQWIASGIGGYLAGRLRTKWTGLHTDEVFFRDTAHGFLAWAIGTMMMVLLIAAGGSSTLNAGSRAAANPAAAQVANTAAPGSTSSAQPGGSPAQAAPRGSDTAAPANAPSDQTRQAADQARKTAAFGSIATALAMLVGAFVGAVSGALGGRLRDSY